MIGLLGAPKSAKKPEGGLLEPMMDLPLAMQDEAINKGNKAKAVLKAQYGPAEGKQSCASCEYFKTEYPGLMPGEGVCDVYEFITTEKKVCLAWEFDKEEGEEEGNKEEDMGEDSEGMED